MKAIPKLTVEMVMQVYNSKWLSTTTENNLLNRNHLSEYQLTNLLRGGLNNYLKWLLEKGELSKFYNDLLKLHDEQENRFP